FDANWTFTAASELWHVNSPQAAALETRFGVDANGDGVVGPIFSPTAQEQYMLELINRARANPLGEVARNSDVFDLNQGLAAGTITSDAKQPLAFNASLINAARAHSQWMLDTDTFSHTGVGGSSAHNRMVAAGYPFTGSWTSGENISWRGTTGTPDIDTSIGMQHDGLFTSAGHRTNLMNANFREIGVGALVGEFTRTGVTYNAVMVTQNFAKSGNDVFLTGVVYNDSVFADNFYTIGEGTGGITIQAVNSDGQVFTTTSFLSGGYTLALQPSTYTVNFFGGSLTQPISTVVNLSSRNVKLDLNTGQFNFAIQGQEQLTQSGEERDELIGYEVKSQTVSLAADPLTEATIHQVENLLLSFSLGDIPSIGYDVLTQYQAEDTIEFEDMANNQWVTESIDGATNLSAIEDLFDNHGLSAGSTQAFTVNGYEDTFLALNDHALGLNGTAMPLFD
ncbi:MAG: CAP domain-containing protein, partial [Nodosilinea sp.]